MYIWSHILARVWINWKRLPIPLVVSKISLFLFAPENLVSRNGFGSPVPRQPLLRLNLALTYGILPEFHGGVSLFI